MMDAGITTKPFGIHPEFGEVSLFQLRNRTGLAASIINLGGIATSLITPDRNGIPADIVLGCDTIDGYLAGHPYFGAIIGRYANRIAHGAFELDGRMHSLTTNDGAHHLHGGVSGFDKALWRAEIDSGSDGPGVVLRWTSEDGDEGYPGTLDATVTYRLTHRNELHISYEASTDAPTHVNLSHHSYFNLGGHDAGDISDHEVMIDADGFTPVDQGLIPTGEIRSVDGSPFDLRLPARIGARIDADHDQLRIGSGFDHNWVLNPPDRASRIAARVTHPGTGRVLDVETTEPGLQFYTGNALDGTQVGKDRVRYGPRAGFCLETQHLPDSPNNPHFPSTVLRPGSTYRSTTIYRFSVTA